MPTRETILNRIHVLTGLDSLFDVESIEWARASEANIPFLERDLEGKESNQSHVQKRGELKLKPTSADDRDKNVDRQFVVLLDAEANKILSLTSTIAKTDPSIHPEQSLEQIEMEISRGGERYQSLPNIDPRFTFVDALDIIAKTFESPLDAQQD